MEYLLLLAGLFILVFSGKYLVKGSVSLATGYRVSKLVIGVTVVAFGTSAPELFISVLAVINGHPAISAGNVIGSNIANIALILGLTAIGTSIPELTTSTIAAFRKEMDISIGNIIGSNIFNILGVMGIASVIKEIK